MNGQTGSVQSSDAKDPEAELSQWKTLPDQETIAGTLDEVKSRGINVERVPTPQEALERITKIIPEGSELMTGLEDT